MKGIVATEKSEFEHMAQDEARIYKNFDIKHLFGKENLESIQDRIARATGLAFVTVDYKGEPVTELTSFTEFCKSIREDKKEEKLCRSSDAFGAIQATVTQKTSVYFCPCGLLEVAIPIVVRGHYLGGFIGGQIRCMDAPDNVCRLENVMHHAEDFKRTKKDLFNRILVLKYQQFVNFTDLISMIINQLGEKELSRLMQKDIANRAMEEYGAREKKMRLEYIRKESELSTLHAQMNPSFLLRSLNAVSNLAAIENAPRTNEMVNLLSDFVRHTVSNSRTSVPLVEEMDNIERYLKIQQIRLGDRLNYSIQLPESLHMQKIPGSLLFPFIEKSVFCGIGLKPEGGTLRISVSAQKEKICIRIADTGLGLNEEQLTQKLLPYKENGFEEEIESSISLVNRRLASLGPGCGTTTKVDPQNGTEYTIVYPQNIDELNEKEI